ncbi:MAG TPA: hypothetical protein PKN70_11585 [Smithellaceae bacterium]|nr:hypothetical protein [Smithellaceae bacterium]
MLLKNKVLYVCSVFLTVSCVWLSNPAQYISDDAYFYLVLARNLVAQGLHSFSGVFITNGVHPLWTYVLTGYTLLVNVAHPGLIHTVTYAIPLSAICLAFGSYNFFVVGRRMGKAGILLPLLPSCYLTFFGVLYSEAHFFYLMLSLITRFIATQPPQTTWRQAQLGALGAAVILARLDSIFLIFAVMVWRQRQSRSIAKSLIPLSVCSLILLPYLLSNWIFFGGLMPVSGWMKSSFPLLNPRGYEPPLTLLGSSIPFGILPLIAGLAALINSRISHENKKMLGIYLFGAFCQFLYVGLFTRSHTFWRWYYVVPMILLALSTSLFASTFGNKCRPVVYAVIILCLGGLISGSFLKFSRDESPENKALKIIRYLADNQIHHQTILVSDFPGQVASQDMSNRIIAADMLTGNRRLYQEMKDSGNALEYLLRLCRNKGKPIAYIIYVGNYFLVPDGRGEKIVYNDPKRYPDQIPWGSLNVPSGPLYSEPGFMVWKPDLP